MDDPGLIIAKMNSLCEPDVIRELYVASQAGVRIKLVIRGICTLVPGAEGISENITVRSVVDRFLEHSRIYWFRNGGEDDVLLGSADLMPRNLNRRVEILFPVPDSGIVRRLRDEILATYLADNMKTRVLNAEGIWVHTWPVEGEEQLNSQEWFVARAREAVRGEEGVAR